MRKSQANRVVSSALAGLWRRHSIKPGRIIRRGEIREVEPGIRREKIREIGPDHWIGRQIGRRLDMVIEIGGQCEAELEAVRRLRN